MDLLFTAPITESSYYLERVGSNWTNNTHLDEFLGEIDRWNNISLYVLHPTMVLTGTIFNILTLFVTQRPQFRKGSIGLYMALVAAMDTLFLWTSAPTMAFCKTVFGTPPNLHSQVSCKLLEYIKYTASVCSAWYIVCLTLERLLVVRMPFESRRIATRGRAWRTCLIVTCVIALIYSWVLIKFTIEKKQCLYLQGENSSTNRLIFYVVDLVLYSFLPSLIITIANLTLVFTLRRRDHPELGGNSTSSASGSRSLLPMLATMSLVFVITTLPTTIMWLIREVSQYNGSNGTNTRAFKETHLGLQALATFNHAFNFLLYVLSGATFRKVVLDLCKSLTCPSHSSCQSKESRVGNEVEVEVQVQSIFSTTDA